MTDHEHNCRPPVIAVSVPVMLPLQPDWTCGECSRVWRDSRSATGLQWWAEVRGPGEPKRIEKLEAEVASLRQTVYDLMGRVPPTPPAWGGVQLSPNANACAGGFPVTIHSFPLTGTAQPFRVDITGPAPGAAAGSVIPFSGGTP